MRKINKELGTATGQSISRGMKPNNLRLVRYTAS